MHHVHHRGPAGGVQRRSAPPRALALTAVIALLGAGVALACEAQVDETPDPGAAQPTPAIEQTPDPGEPEPTPDAEAPEPDAAEEPEAWDSIPDAPIALTEVAGAAHDGQAWVAGGLLENGAASTDVLVFDPEAGTWSEGPPLPTGLHHTAMVSTGDELYVVGGLEGDYPGTPTADVIRLADDGSGWEAAPSLPEARGAGAAAWDGRRILFGGGLTTGGDVADAIWALEDGSWTAVGSLSEPREHLAATSDGNGRTWFMAGRQVRLVTNVGVVDLVEAEEVTRLEAELTPRSGVAAFWAEGFGACLAGGEGPDGTHDEVECIGDDGEVHELPALEVARHGLGAAVIDGEVYVLLGGERPGLYVSSVGERLTLGASALR
jgi:hypothetical protein